MARPKHKIKIKLPNLNAKGDTVQTVKTLNPIIRRNTPLKPHYVDREELRNL